ncbi:MAG: hypothetical protein J5524_05925 [Bacteroidaceae bacterium]|nr:hypothetical protein [Bacteroidaceae bacterium]
MKQKLLYIILMILCTFAWSGEAWGDTGYVLDAVSSFSDAASQYGESEEFQLNGPGATLSVVVKKYTAITAGGIDIYAYNGEKWSVIYTCSDLSTKEKTYTCSVNQNVTKIKLKGNLAGTRYFKNLKVTRATTLSLASGVSSTLDMGSIRVGKSTSSTIRVAFNNTTYNQTLTGSCTNTTFTVTSKSLGEKGEADIKINFTAPTTAGKQTGRVTLTMGTATTTFDVTAEAADKGTPAFMWNLTNAYKNHSYSDFFTSTNTDTGYTITSSNPLLGNVVNGKLVFYDGEGTVRFTVTQDGDADWYTHEEYFDVTVTEAQNHLPLTITSDNFGTLVRGVSGDCKWINGGIYLSNNGYNDKTAEIVFDGIPYQISFDFERHNAVATSVDFNLKLSADGNNWDEVWSSSSTSGSQTYTFTNEQLNHKYVRLTYGGNFDATFKNVTITERKYLTADKTSLASGTNTKGNNVAAQTFTISHCNAGYGVTVSSNNANFTVSPTTLTSTGGDVMGTQVITVTYLNNTTGVHNGTITISDPNGTNSPITINVSGTTQTTYYTRADAETGVGGNAYVSYVSSDDAAANQHTSTSLKSSGLTSEANATNNAYWIAVPEQGYTFVEWQWPNGTQASTNASYKREGYEYNSEDQNNPTVVKFKAIFAPKILTLQPTSSTYTVDYYKTVYLNWALKSGYSTIALPFNTTVEDIVGDDYDSVTDWVAQLSVVTYNAKDGYSLYFEKKSDIVANQPYILHLGSAVASPVFTNVSVVAAATATQYTTKGVKNANQWVLHSNYNPTFDMEGYYGVVGEKIKKGAEGSSLKAYHAYIEGPTAAAVKVAYLDDDEADGLLEVLEGEVLSAESVYDLQGRQLPKVGKGINIIRGADGSFKKILSK